MKSESITLNASSIIKYFSNSSNLNSKDVIVAVRSIVEDPRIAVIVDCDTKLSVEELKRSAIYIKDENDEEIDEFGGVDIGACCIFNADTLSEEQLNRSDLGLQEHIDYFASRYQIQQFSILIIGAHNQKSIDRLLTIWNSVQLQTGTNYSYNFPTYLSTHLRKLPNGLDISKSANILQTYRIRNELNYATLQTVLDEIDNAVANGCTAIQSMASARTLDVKWLSMYANLRHQLAPVYLESHISEYVNLQPIYPFEKLSLYERLSFLRNVPKVIGYIGHNQLLRCVAIPTEKIYPNPSYAFDLTSGALADPDDFNLADLKWVDYRHYFEHPEITGTSANDIALRTKKDEEVDHELVNIFMGMSALVDQDIYLSVKNTLIVTKNNRGYLVYCPESLGLRVMVTSEYFGQTEMIIPEEDFKQLIDARVLLAVSKREACNRQEEGIMLYSKTMLDTPETLTPAIPLDIAMRSSLLSPTDAGLSYYDTMLRCCKNVLPIIVDPDSKLKTDCPLLDMLSIKSLRADDYARYNINAFGTLSILDAINPVIPITIRAFQGRGIL